MGAMAPTRKGSVFLGEGWPFLLYQEGGVPRMAFYYDLPSIIA